MYRGAWALDRQGLNSARILEDSLLKYLYRAKARENRCSSLRDQSGLERIKSRSRLVSVTRSRTGTASLEAKAQSEEPCTDL